MTSASELTDMSKKARYNHQLAREKHAAMCAPYVTGWLMEKMIENAMSSAKEGYQRAKIYVPSDLAYTPSRSDMKELKTLNPEYYGKFDAIRCSISVEDLEQFAKQAAATKLPGVRTSVSKRYVSDWYGCSDEKIHEGNHVHMHWN